MEAGRRFGPYPFTARGGEASLATKSPPFLALGELGGARFWGNDHCLNHENPVALPVKYRQRTGGRLHRHTFHGHLYHPRWIRSARITDIVQLTASFTH